MTPFFGMFPVFFILVFGLVAVAFFFSFRSQIEARRDARDNKVDELTDARAHAERWINRLGNELLTSTPPGPGAAGGGRGDRGAALHA